jgi:hypothetical protein
MRRATRTAVCALAALAAATLLASARGTCIHDAILDHIENATGLTHAERAAQTTARQL